MHQVNIDIHNLQLNPVQQKACQKITKCSSFFQEIILDLTQCQHQLTSSQFRWALETLLALSVLERKAEKFSQILNEPERHQTITNKCGLIAEIALTKGNNSQEVLLSIQGRIEEVRTTYLTDQSNHNTLAFFQDAFQGLPCFNGRLLNIRQYSLTRQHGLACEDVFFDKTDFDTPACLLENAIYEYQDAQSSDDIPDQFTLTSYLKGRDDYEKNWKSMVEGETFPRIYSRACDIIEGGEL